ncbi:MAG: TIGR02328 family protein [Bacteroidales bacterium]|nr:TIGR02328 family protein [Bacteroidales bacterium]
MDLIGRLPMKQLLGQHRECCALRGLGWGRKHSVVDYVFRNPYCKLYFYHRAVMAEMERRGYSPDKTWTFPNYRGKKIGFDPSVDSSSALWSALSDFGCRYEEHDDAYLEECIDNLKSKGVVVK